MFTLHAFFAIVVLVMWTISGSPLASKFPGWQLFYLGWAVIALDYLVAGTVLVK